MPVLHFPPSIQWELTANCNHDCIHCYNFWRKDLETISNVSKLKTEEEYLQIARRIVDLRPVAVTLTGGEPLLVFDKIRSTIELLQRNDIVVTINTNASLLNDAICQYLREKDIHLFVSFPCAEPSVCDLIVNKKGAFNKIVDGLDAVQLHGIVFSCNIVVSKKNIDYLEKTVDFLVERYRCTLVSVTRASKPINSDDSFNELMLDFDYIHKLLDIIVGLKNKYPNLTIDTACPYTPCSLNSQEAFDLYGYKKICTAGKTSFSLDTNGNFKACARDDRVYGNILEDDFVTIYNRMHEWRDGSFIPKECKSCKELSRCHGGCRTDSIPFTGRSDVLDRISDLNNLPIKYVAKPRKCNVGSMVFSFDPNSVKCIIDGDMVRLSRERNYVMITLNLYAFLKNNGNRFSSDDLSKAFNKSKDITDKVIKRLLLEGIIHPI